MDENHLFKQISVAIKNTLKSNVRFWRSERAFQAEFYCFLKQSLTNSDLIPEGAILESEHQKVFKEHGITHRPDILLHTPSESGVTKTRREGNFIALEIKTSTDKKDIEDAIDKLNDYTRILEYKIGILININAETSSLKQTEGNEKIHELLVLRECEKIKIKHIFFKKGKFREELF